MKSLFRRRSSRYGAPVARRSTLMCSGVPCSMNRSASTSITSFDRKRRSGTIARHSPDRPSGRHIPCATGIACAPQADLSTGLDRGGSSANKNIHLTQSRADLLRRKSLTSPTFLQLPGPARLSSKSDQFFHGRPVIDPPEKERQHDETHSLNFDSDSSVTRAGHPRPSHYAVFPCRLHTRHCSTRVDGHSS